MSESEPEIKYVMQLSGVDIGKRVVWIQKYRYDGKEKEKVMELVLKRVTHGAKASYLYHRDSDPTWQYNVRKKVNPNILVAVYDK